MKYGVPGAMLSSAVGKGPVRHRFQAKKSALALSVGEWRSRAAYNFYYHYDFDVVSYIGATWIGNGSIGILDRFESAGMNLVETVLADHAGRNRYEAPQWMAANDFLTANPVDPDASALREWIANNRRTYLKYGRRYLGWGIFVLRLASTFYS